MRAVTRAQALAFRVARHHLAGRAPDAASAAVVGLQDTPPGAAATAFAARADGGPDAFDELVLVQSLRGAPWAVAPADVPVFTAGLAPPDEAAAAKLIGNAAKVLDGIAAMEALDRVSAAVADALADGPLGRDDFHQALRERLPDDLLWWCKGCGTHHVHPSLWRATGVRGVLAVVGREGRSAVFGAPPGAKRVKDPGGELARRFLRAYGPATPALLAGWAGLTAAHARGLWEQAGELAEVKLAGERAWVLAEDADAVADPPDATGVRLLPNLDPIGTARDREVLVPDAEVRKAIWRPVGGPGIVLRDGRLAGLWRAAKQGKRLVVTVEPVGRFPKTAVAAVEAEAERLAPFRAAERVEVAVETA